MRSARSDAGSRVLGDRWRGPGPRWRAVLGRGPWGLGRGLGPVNVRSRWRAVLLGGPRVGNDRGLRPLGLRVVAGFRIVRHVRRFGSRRRRFGLDVGRGGFVPRGIGRRRAGFDPLPLRRVARGRWRDGVVRRPGRLRDAVARGQPKRHHRGQDRGLPEVDRRSSSRPAERAHVFIANMPAATTADAQSHRPMVRRRRSFGRPR